MDKLSQLRQMREHRQRGFAALRRQLNAETKIIAAGPQDWAQISSPHEVSSEPDTKRVAKAEKRKRSTAVRPVETRHRENEGKPAMTEATPQVWDKGDYQARYMRWKRAKTDYERSAALTALRTAFPKTRPRKVKAPAVKTIKVAAPKKKKPVRKKVKAKSIKAKAKPAVRKKSKKKGTRR